MNIDPFCPPANELREVVAEPAYGAFAAGWCAGTLRRTTQPACQEVIEQIATMLDSASLSDTLSRPE
ncbi:hypothetical protein Q7C18_06880 [Nesterenkonia sp. CL21]|uniref:hypothetical protein n=1 Tax=Nesterenkonia sp. CL21 TaxID=3064894 RepID=UPI00287A9150|nr:hypothetical protein [Nesterenkonia sp. CL21]MDS2172414.1 hypothetical protein [Nesterenkonia sp. CL21]